MQTSLKKTIFLTTVILSLCLFFLLPADTVKAETRPGYQHIYDEAGLLSTNEYQTLEELCIKYTQKNDTVFILLTHNDPDTVDGEIYIENLYDTFVYGDSVIALVDMYRRDVVIQAYGSTQYIIDNREAKEIADKMSPLLTDEDYVGAFKKFLKSSDKYINAVPIYQNSLVHLVVALVIGGITVGIMAYNSGGKMTTGGNTYLDSNNSGLVGRRDNYIYTQVTRVRKPDDNAGGSGGGHSVSAGGHSHSSGRSSF